MGILGTLVIGIAGNRSGLFAALVLSSCAGLQVMARAADPGMAFALGTGIAGTALSLWFSAPPGERPRWAWWAAGLAAGFGCLAGGPLGLLLPLLTILAGMLLVPAPSRPTWAEAGRALGAAAALGLVVAAPWMLWTATRPGADAAACLLGRLGEFSIPGHRRNSLGPAFLLPFLVGGFLPWSLFLPGALGRLSLRPTTERERLRLLMALFAGTSLVVLSLSRTRVPADALLLLVPLAVLVGIDLREGSGRTNAAVTLRSKLPCMALAGIGLLVAASPALLGLFSGSTGSAELADGSIVTIESPVDGLRNEAIGMTAYMGGLFLVLGGVGGVASRSQTLRVAAVAASWLLLLPGCLSWWRDFDGRERRVRDFAALVKADRAPGDVLAAYRKRLPSLGFYAGGSVAAPRTPKELARLVAQPGRAWIVLQRRDFADLAAGAKGAEAERAVLARFEELAVGGSGGLRDLVLLRER